MAAFFFGDFCNKIGTSRTSGDIRPESAKWAKADIDQVAVADAHMQNDESGTVRTCYRSKLVLQQK
jgi:hypothetical protein